MIMFKEKVISDAANEQTDFVLKKKRVNAAREKHLTTKLLQAINVGQVLN